MRNKLLFISGALILCLTIIISGCGGEKEPQISEEVRQIMADTASVSLGATSYKFKIEETVSVVALGGIQAGTTTMDVSMTGDIDIVSKTMHGFTTMNTGKPGPVGSETTMETYVVGEWLYIKTSVPETKDQWTKMQLTPEMWETQNQIEQQIELMGSGYADLIGSGVVDGVDCYKLKVTPDTGLLAKYMLQQAGTDQQLAKALSISSVESTQWVSKDSSLVIRCYTRSYGIISPDSISGTTVKNFIDMTIDALIYDYNQPVTIELPVEARAATEISID